MFELDGRLMRNLELFGPLLATVLLKLAKGHWLRVGRSIRSSAVWSIITQFTLRVFPQIGKCSVRLGVSVSPYVY